MYKKMSILIYVLAACSLSLLFLPEIYTLLAASIGLVFSIGFVLWLKLRPTKRVPDAGDSAE